jgi:serralysin
MLQLVSCDPNVAVVDIYHLLDEPALAGWQSGLYYVDHTAKQSALTVHDWIASTGGNCQGAPHPWTPPGVPQALHPAPPAAVKSGPRIVVSAGGRIRVFDAGSQVLKRVIAPFGASFSRAMPIAVGDVNRDGVADYAAAGSSAVKIVNGKSGGALATYSVPAVSVALGDVNGDGRADLVVATAGQVKVFDGKSHALLESLTPFGPAYRGGITVAAGDLDADGKAEVIAGQAAGGSVIAFSGLRKLETLRPFSAGYSRGVTLAAGDVNGDGKADVIAGTGAGTPALIRAFSGATSKRLLSFAPYGGFSGGATVAAANVAGDAAAEIVVGQGAGGGAQVSVFDGRTAALASTFLGSTGSPGIAVGAD